MLIYRPRWRSDAVFDTFHALWRAILRSNSRSRRTLIYAQRVTACILCLKSPLYLVLLFLVWKQYWKMVASTLLRFFLSSKGMDSTSRLVLAFSIRSRPKYLQLFLPSLFSTRIFHLSSFTGMALMTSPVCLSVTSRVCSSVCSRSKREGLPRMPLATKSMPFCSANSRFSSPWYAPSECRASTLPPVTSSEPFTPDST